MRVLRRAGVALGSLAALAVIGYALLYALSERVLRRTYPVPRVSVSIPTDADSIAEGRRLAIVHGCFGACHGRGVEGQVLFDRPAIARLVAPNLTAAVRRYTDEELGAIIRHGVRPDGRSMMAMPSEDFVWLTDADLGCILAFLKSLPPVPGPGPEIRQGPLGRLGVATGRFRTAAQLIAEAVPPPPAASPEAARGRYLAQTICAHCHGSDLRGASNPEFTSPPLLIVAAYTEEAFVRLLRTGMPLGDKVLATMGPYARGNLAQLTDAEIASLYAYLHALPEGMTH